MLFSLEAMSWLSFCLEVGEGKEDDGGVCDLLARAWNNESSESRPRKTFLASSGQIVIEAEMQVRIRKLGVLQARRYIVPLRTGILCARVEGLMLRESFDWRAATCTAIDALKHARRAHRHSPRQVALEASLPDHWPVRRSFSQVDHVFSAPSTFSSSLCQRPSRRLAISMMKVNFDVGKLWFFPTLNAQRAQERYGI